MPGEFVSKIVFTFTLPCAVLHAFGAADFSPQMLLLVPLGFVFAFGAYLVTFAITPRTKREDRTFYLLNGCGFNLGCFALPFVPRPSSLPPWPWPPASTMPATRS